VDDRGSFGRRARALARRVRAILFPEGRDRDDAPTVGSSAVEPAGERVRYGAAWRAPRARPGQERRRPRRSRDASAAARDARAGRTVASALGPWGTVMPDRAWLAWWPMTGWHFGVLIQAIALLSASALAEDSAHDPRHVRPSA
jgi:hypothetical protein